MDGQLSQRDNCAVVVHWRYLSPPAWFVRMWALTVISLLRSDSVAFGCEADMRTVD
jgi:hypothetical protein